MGAAVGALLRLLSGYGLFKVVEEVFGNPDVVVSNASEKTGVPKVILWIGIVAAAFVALRYFFKSKSL